jgi:hypothetical protein
VDSNIGSETYGDVAFTRGIATQSRSKWFGCIDCKYWNKRISWLEKKSN